ncbi:hypothetical protein AN958_05734 [Leucoagaricus sp. SymC.cos]|nr:hypothetical protein AN958_05734 [Leucoagaricus sp. SymC.cos]
MIVLKNINCTRKLFEAFTSPPTKLIAFLLLGRMPLQYFGYLKDIPLPSVVGVAGFGGLALATLYLSQKRCLPVSGPQAFSPKEEGRERREEIKLDWALQEFMILQLVGEIYHTVAGIAMGVWVMRILKLCVIDQQHLDLLMAAGMLGLMLAVILVISLAVLGFGAIWCALRCRDLWEGRMTVG